MRLEPGDIPVWVGTVAEQGLYRPLGLIAIPSTGGDFAAALYALEREGLHGLQWRRVRRGREVAATRNRHWNGETLLIREPPARTVGAGP